MNISLKKFSSKINSFLDVPVTDQDDARRRKLLNIILATASIFSIIFIITTFFAIAFKYAALSESLFLYGATGATLFFSVIFYFLNRSKRLPGWLASTLFVALLAIVISFTDTPSELVDGRSLVVWMVPIFLGTFLLQPSASMIFFIFCIGEMFIVGRTAGVIPNPFALVIFFLLTGVALLFSRGENRAIKEVRAINVNLDRLVAERTQALADALSRERIDAGRIKAILESIADGVIVFDVQGKAIIANPSCKDLLGLPIERILGSYIVDLSHSKQLDTKNAAQMVNLLTNPGQQEFSTHIEWGEKSISATSAEVFDMDNNPIGTVAVFRDYTHEAELDHMKDTFLAIVSHELRTPLNAILGYAEMLKEAVYGPVNEKQAHGAERILTNTQRLLGIVNDLLDQSQIEAGRMSINYQPFHTNDLIDNVHSVMDKIASDKGIVLTSRLDTTLPFSINGDIARLQQILVNLINNAIKFTDKGSVNFCLLRSDLQHWELQVQDTGIGIPENEIPRIFESFHQVDSSVTRKYGGFGLGLSIVKKLANLMGGRVIVKSKVGIGSTFTVTLPLVQQGGKLYE